MSGLPAGQFLALAQARGTERQFYDGVDNRQDATPIDLDGENSVDTIDFQLSTIDMPGGQIHGVVTDIESESPIEGAVVIAISTKMGSIDDNSSGGFVAYRSSKSALNSAWKSLAVDNPTVVCAVLHPGWVQTRMGGESAPLSPADSVAGMRRVIEGLGREQSGGFFAYDGAEIPW